MRIWSEISNYTKDNGSEFGIFTLYINERDKTLHCPVTLDSVGNLVKMYVFLTAAIHQIFSAFDENFSTEAIQEKIRISKLNEAEYEDLEINEIVEI